MSNWTFRITGRPPKDKKIYHFGRWLKQSLHAHKITIKAFADLTGIDKANLYNYVRGRSLPSMMIYIYIVEGVAKVTKKKKETILIESYKQLTKDI